MNIFSDSHTAVVFLALHSRRLHSGLILNVVISRADMSCCFMFVYVIIGTLLSSLAGGNKGPCRFSC